MLYPKTRLLSSSRALIRYGFRACLLLAGPMSALAQTTYYVANSGSDANDGHSEGTPLQTLAKVSSLPLQPGDVILFRRGDTFRGSLQISRSGSTDRPIVFDAYGSGNKPVIAGSESVNTWTNVGGNVWQASCPSCGSRVTGLYRNETSLPLGRYPNLSDANKGYLTVQSHSGKSQLTSQQPLGRDWTGGEAVIRPLLWILDRATITQQSGNTLNLNNPNNRDIADGWGFFIQNHPGTLDQTGEWYYNPATKTISLFDEQNNPNSQTITATIAEQGIRLAGVNFVTIRNLHITETLSTGLLVDSGSNLAFSGNDITNSGEDAVYITGFGNTILAENNRIENANNNGFSIQPYPNFTFRGNTIRNVGLWPGRGRSGDGTYVGLQSLSAGGTLIEHNVVDRVGFNGISYTNGTVVRRNQVANFCMVKSDGGGLYTWNGNRQAMHDIRLEANIIYNGIGAPEGTPGGSYTGANGIFFDDCASNVAVVNNTVFNCRGLGLFLRAASAITATGNTVYNNEEGQLAITHNHGHCQPRGNVLRNNVFVSRLPNQFNVKFESNANDLGEFGQFDQNVYARPFEDLYKIRAVYNNGQGIVGTDLSLPEWQNRFGKDQNSQNSSLTFKTYAISGTGETKLDNNFSNNSQGWDTWSPYGNGRADWENGRLDGGSLRVSFPSPSNQSNSYVIVSNNIGSISAGRSYVVRFNAIASSPTKQVQVFIRQKNGSYRDLDARSAIQVGTTRQSYEVAFTAQADESNAILVFQVNEDGHTVWFDNIRLQEANRTAVNPDDYIRLVYNATDQESRVTLDGRYRGMHNELHQGSITLAPYASAVLLKETRPAEPTSLREPENPANAVAGLNYTYYEGSWSALPDFNSLTPVKTGQANAIDLAIRNRDQHIAVRYQGFIDIPADGVYTFYTTSDDGSKLYIGDTEVVNNDGVHPPLEQSGTIGLKAGKHALTVTFFEYEGGEVLDISYSGPNVPKQSVPASAFYHTTSPTPTSNGVTYLSDLSWADMKNGYGAAEKDRSNGEAGEHDGRTLTLNGVSYNKGLGVHAPSEITYNLGGRYNTFMTDMGIDDEIGDGDCGSVVFEVYIDNVLAYSSSRMTPTTATESTRLDVTGKQTLKLVVTAAGDNPYCDHADWANARLIGTGNARLAAESPFNSVLPARVYPIPARDELEVSYYAATSGKLTMQLTSPAAQTVAEVTYSVMAGENRLKLPVRSFTRGIYVLSLIQNNQRVTRKVILSE